MKDIVAAAVLAAVIGLAVFYVYRAKKRGDKCIGCPYVKDCSGKCNNSQEM